MKCYDAALLAGLCVIIQLMTSITFYIKKKKLVQLQHGLICVVHSVFVRVSVAFPLVFIEAFSQWFLCDLGVDDNSNSRSDKMWSGRNNCKIVSYIRYKAEFQENESVLYSLETSRSVNTLYLWI